MLAVCTISPEKEQEEQIPEHARDTPTVVSASSGRGGLVEALRHEESE